MSGEMGRVGMSDPVAYFLTWTTYGSWLPGDERGWVEKPGRIRESHWVFHQAARRRMTDGELALETEQREIVKKTVADHCQVRGWRLHAVKCLTQHVHVVVTAPDRDPEDVMDQLKAWCSRRLKERAASTGEASAKVRKNWWTQRGSRRQLFDDASLEAAVRYVLEGQ